MKEDLVTENKDCLNFVMGLSIDYNFYNRFISNDVPLSSVYWQYFTVQFETSSLGFYWRKNPNPGGGTLGIAGWGCAAGSLEPLTFSRASSAEFCYPILE